MLTYDTEQKRLDDSLCREDEGAVLQVTGWTILGFCCITCIWILIGWRTGSWFWFWMNLAIVLAGAGLLVTGGLMRRKAAADLAAVRAAIRTRIASTPAEEPQPAGEQPRVA